MDKTYITDANTMHQTNLENQITKKCLLRITYRFLEACAGIGAISKVLPLLAERLGMHFICEAISEIDSKAIEAYEAINGCVQNLGDFDKIDWSRIFVDFISLTFPCQDISSAGRKKGFKEDSSTRSALVWSIKKMLSEMPHKPTFIFMENVAAILNKRNKPTFDKLIAYLESQGYYVHFHKIDAAEYGIPQHRERVFIICVLGHAIKFDAPAPMPLRFTLSEILEKNVDEKYYLKNLKNYFIEHSMESPYTFRVMNPSHCDIAYTITTRSGSRISDNFIFEDDISTDKVVRIKEKNLSKLGIPLDKVKTTRIRKLTPTEVMRLFDLTEDEIAKLSHLPDTTIYQLMGNSIVVPALTEYLYAFFKAYMEQVLMIPVDDVKLGGEAS